MTPKKIRFKVLSRNTWVQMLLSTRTIVVLILGLRFYMKQPITGRESINAAWRTQTGPNRSRVCSSVDRWVYSTLLVRITVIVMWTNLLVGTMSAKRHKKANAVVGLQYGRQSSQMQKSDFLNQSKQPQFFIIIGIIRINYGANFHGKKADQWQNVRPCINRSKQQNETHWEWGKRPRWHCS